VWITEQELPELSFQSRFLTNVVRRRKRMMRDTGARDDTCADQ
jgi:hypothetical protein